MQVQRILDEIIISSHFRSVLDLEYFPEDEVIYVQRKIGSRSTLIDVSEDGTESELRSHLLRVAAIY